MTTLRRICLAAAVVALSGCAPTMSSNGQASAAIQQQEIDSRFNAISGDWQRQKNEGKLSEIEFSERLITLANDLYPNDFSFQALLKYRLFLATELQSERITRPEFDYKLAEKIGEFDRQSRSAPAAAQESQTAQPNVAPYFLLQGMGNAFQRAYSPPGQTQCTTTTVGGVRSTNCY